MRWTRLAAVGVIVGGVAFGFWGGEYSTVDWWQITREVREEREAVRALAVELDSLAAWLEALETDSATQEQVARERFGMIRDGEILYRVEPVEP